MAPQDLTPDQAVRTALAWQGQGRLAEAQALYERVLAVAPRHPEAWHFLGLLRHQLGAREEALECLRQALEADPGYAAAYSNLANLRLERGEEEAAEQAYRRALELDPELLDASLNLGLLYRHQGRLGEAEQRYRQAIGQAPRQPLAHTHLGELLQATGRLEEAVTALERALDLAPDFAPVWRLLGQAYSARRQPEAAARAYQRAVELGADGYLGLATALRDQGLVEEAILAYRKTLAVGGRQATAFYNLGMLLSAQGRPDEAAAIARQWLEWDPGQPVARHLLAACTQTAVPARASEAYVETVFDGFAEVFDQRLRDLEYQAPRLVAEWLRRECGPAKACLRLLDAGCGTGLCAPWLRPHARRLVGVDLSAAMLEQARRRGGYDTLIRAELTAFLEATEESFEVMVAADTLVYFGDLRPVLRAAARVLVPGGCLIATLERAEADPGPSGYHLHGHGRYSHAPGYLEALCAEGGWRLSGCETVFLRQEMGQSVTGLAFCARPPCYTQKGRKP